MRANASPRWTTALLFGAAAAAWFITAQRMRGMDAGPGTDLGGLGWYVGVWVTMTAAMMLPSVAPVAVTWAGSIRRTSRGAARAGRTAGFLGGYLLAWTAFGLLAYAALALTGGLVDEHPGAGRWIAVTVFALAGLHQLGPLKNVCLRHCRSPMTHLLRYAAFRPRARDPRVGLHHGAYCVGCCWALMVLLVPLGVMNVAAMAGLAAVVFLEKLWRHGPVVARVTGVAFLVLAGLAPFHEWLLPGLAEPEPPDDMEMTGLPGP